LCMTKQAEKLYAKTAVSSSPQSYQIEDPSGEPSTLNSTQKKFELELPTHLQFTIKVFLQALSDVTYVVILLKKGRSCIAFVDGRGESVSPVTRRETSP